MGPFKTIDRCFHAPCGACNGKGYDCFDDRQCEHCKGAGQIVFCAASD